MDPWLLQDNLVCPLCRREVRLDTGNDISPRKNDLLRRIYTIPLAGLSLPSFPGRAVRAPANNSTTEESTVWEFRVPREVSFSIRRTLNYSIYHCNLTIFCCKISLLKIYRIAASFFSPLFRPNFHPISVIRHLWAVFILLNFLSFLFSFVSAVSYGVWWHFFTLFSCRCSLDNFLAVFERFIFSTSNLLLITQKNYVFITL